MTNGELLESLSKLADDSPLFFQVLSLIPASKSQTLYLEKNKRGDEADVALFEIAQKSAYHCDVPKQILWAGLKRMHGVFGYTAVGRHGGRSRIDLWQDLTIERLVNAIHEMNTRTLQKMQPTEMVSIDARTSASNPHDAGATASGLLTHRFPLRPGMIIEVSLPLDLTAGEAERIYKFVSAFSQ